QAGQVVLGRLAAPRREVVHTADAGTPLMLRLANGVAGPAQPQLGLPLAEAKGLHRFRHEPAAPRPLEGLRRLLPQGTGPCRQFHWPPPAGGGGYCTDFYLAIYFPVIALVLESLTAGGRPMPSFRGTRVVIAGDRMTYRQGKAVVEFRLRLDFASKPKVFDYQ